MNVAVNPLPDLGLGEIVNDSEQDVKFKIPTLRNVAATAPYSHNGYFPTLAVIVRFHIDRGTLLPDIEANLIDPVTVELSNQKIADIVTFLGSLTDDGL